MPWRTIRNEDDKPLLEYELEKVVKGFFNRELLLDYLRYFVLFEKDGDDVIKKIAGYHQFHAVREAVRVTVIASKIPDVVNDQRAIYGKNVIPGSRKAGVVWHTQGSGKSISMVCYTGKLLQQPEMNNPTIVVVTDRTDLDGQLFQTFSNLQEFLKQTPLQVESREELRKELDARQSGGIIFTTVQKFTLLEKEESHPVLNIRSNIVVISDEAHRIKIVIVRDMWLTGFDVPCAHTMYVDKPMRGHSLMQAIARVNRVFKDKPGGLVVDYIGIANELKHALKTYIDSQGKGRPANLAQEAFAVLIEKMDIVRGMFQGFDYSEFETKALKLLVPAVDHILKLDGNKKKKERKKEFLDAMVNINAAFALCGTLDEAIPLRKEIAFFSAVKAAITKYTTVDKKRTEEEKNSALKQILDNAIVAEGVEDIFKLAGLEKPNIGLLDDAFMEEVRNMKSRNLAVELLEKLLRDEIRAKTRMDVVQQKKYGDRLLETLRKYHNRAIETAQVIEELITMAKDFQEAMKRHEDLGLNPDEVAFYDALANNESAVRELGDKILKKIAQELTDKLRKSTSVDWQVRDSVRARLRNLVRITLRRYKYPPDKQDEAINLVLQQAERLSEEWSSAA
ncbi:MAG: DUF3387 domain-containing protein [Nitrospirae bacterium]|nr:DUF3387 domain-containing protein [Nitrospirota bacterium]